MRGSKMLTGIYLPEKILDNAELEARNILLPSGKNLRAERIKEKIGVERRHISEKDETVADLGYKAVKAAIGERRDIDVIFVSSSHPTSFHVAGEIRNRLGLAEAEVLDFHAACSGSALCFAYLFENKNKYFGKNILVVAADKFSDTIVDLRKLDALKLDPSLGQTIFGDGAVAICFNYGKDIIVHAVNKKSLPDMNGKKDLILMGVGDNKFVQPCIINPVSQSPVNSDYPFGYFTQNGPGVFQVIYNSVPNVIRETVRQANLKPQDIDLVIIHPGSRRVVEAITDALRPDFEVYSDYVDANMSSVSLMYSFVKAMRENRVMKGSKVVLCGFGAGSPDLYSVTVVIELV
jgi:3-oxoacyl-[acyl-carrier-protein] synthase-3